MKKYLEEENMRAELANNDRLRTVDTELIGNGGNSRLSIMCDTSTGEVWSDEWYDHEQNSWKEYHDSNITQVGWAANDIIEEGEGDEIERAIGWSITLVSLDDGDDHYIDSDDFHIESGDSWGPSFDPDNLLEEITERFLNK